MLGIETSCDETAVAVYDSARGLLAHCLHSQIALHAEYGGVVPELASRDHVRKLLPLIDNCLSDAGLGIADIDGVAYTAGPGLAGALLVGAAVGRSLAFARGIPAVGVHHLEGHLLAPMLEADPPRFPFLALLVSGGHTLLAQVARIGEYRILGNTLDDAAGEAFDKTAKLLGLGYPGGPALAKLAEKGRPGKFKFPRPMLDRPGLDFSFSGLKTAVVVALRDAAPKFNSTLKPSVLLSPVPGSSPGQAPGEKQREGSLDEQVRADMAFAFEEAVVETLAAKCDRALQQSPADALVVAGGVGANRRLRQRLDVLGRRWGIKVHYPRPEFCTDNAAMIAYAGCQRLLAGERDNLGIRAQARWPIDSLQVPRVS